MPIPRKLAAAVENASACKCCLCPRRGDHLHHINGQPSDNRFENLALLCFQHHEEASFRPLAETILRQRTAWYEEVTASRAQAAPARLPTVLRAILVHEVRKIRYELQHKSQDFRELARLIRQLAPHAAEGELALRREVLEALDVAAAKTRAGIPGEAALAVLEIATAAAIRGSLVAPSPRGTRYADSALLEGAAYIGFVLAHDGAKYLRNLEVVDAGGSILSMVLRYAHLNKLRKLEARTHVYFAKARKAAQDDAARWLQFKEDDALALGAQIPSDVARQLRE